MNLFFLFVFPLLTTLVLESISNTLLLRAKIAKGVYYTLLINLITWPAANIIFGMGVNFFAIEAGVVLIEAILIMLLFQKHFPKAFLVSFAGNFITASITYFRW